MTYGDSVPMFLTMTKMFVASAIVLTLLPFRAFACFSNEGRVYWDIPEEIVAHLKREGCGYGVPER